MKAIVAGVAFLVILLSGCSNSNNNNNPTNGGGNNANYFFTATFREVNGPKTGSMNTSLFGSNPSIYKDTVSASYPQTMINTNINSRFSDSIQFSIDAPYPLQMQTYADTPYKSINVKINLASPVNDYNITGVQFPGGSLAITSLTSTEAKGNFNLFATIRGSLVDTLYLTGAFDLPYTP